MIEILPQSTTSCLAVHFNGKGHYSETQQFMDTHVESPNTDDQASMVVELTGFEFYDDLEATKQVF